MCSSCRFCLDVYLLLSPRGMISLRFGCAALLPLLVADLGEWSDRGTIDDLAKGIEPRSMAGAVPRGFGRIPGHDAAQVRADCRAPMEHTAVVTVRRHLRQSVTDHGT